MKITKIKQGDSYKWFIINIDEIPNIDIAIKISRFNNINEIKEWIKEKVIKYNLSKQRITNFETIKDEFMKLKNLEFN